MLFHKLLFLFKLVIYINFACSNKNNKPLFSTKTPYINLERDLFEIKLEGYTHEYVAFVARHGSRYPNTKDLKSISNILDKLVEVTDDDCMDEYGFNETAIFLRNEMQNAENLTQLGKKQMLFLAEKLKLSVGHFFDDIPMSKFVMMTTCKDRTMDSAISFMKAFDYHESIPCDDRLLRYFDNCPKYDTITANNEVIIQEEMRKMANSASAFRVVEKLNKNLQCKDCLNFQDAFSLYKLCVFKMNVAGDEYYEGVCKLFDNYSFDFFDYYLDIKQFWKRGPGNPFNCEISCGLLKNMVDNVIKAANNFCSKKNTINHESKRGLFYFAHAETILPLVCLMGYFNQKMEIPYFINSKPLNISLFEEINFENYEKFKGYNRFFRTGNIVPMGANLVFHLLCPIDKSKQPIVLIILNEERLVLPCCAANHQNKPKDLDHWGCTLDQFIKCFKIPNESCSLKNSCYNDEF